jgi:hypothetical protein
LLLLRGRRHLWFAHYAASNESRHISSSEARGRGYVAKVSWRRCRNVGYIFGLLLLDDRVSHLNFLGYFLKFLLFKLAVLLDLRLLFFKKILLLVPSGREDHACKRMRVVLRSPNDIGQLDEQVGS